MSCCKLSIFLIIAGVVFYATGNPTVTLSKENCRKKLAECSISTGVNNVPVCGSDGVTYPSECQIVTKQCQGISISIKQSGPCPETPPCFSAKIAMKPGSQPACRADGTYEPVQCHVETGYCWCVTPQGRPLPDTSVKDNKPNCDEIDLLSSSSSSSLSSSSYSKRNSYKSKPKMNNNKNDNKNLTGYSPARRSPHIIRVKKNKIGRHQMRDCSHQEKSDFNKNLIDLFKIEYRRINNSDGDQNNERVLSWKFSTLDKDADGQLDSDEYKELKRLAKKNVKPKRCGKTFLKTCDTDEDMYLSKSEWTTCLRSDFTLLKEAPVHERPGLVDVTPDQTENDANDCLSDRKSVLDDQLESSKEKKTVYVPECTPDGRYNKIQCYSGYCWCVLQDTGKPIPGTSSKDGMKPNCNPVPSPSRIMKGCPEDMKQEFLRNFIDSIEEKMQQSNTNADKVSDKLSASREERIVTWHFSMLDENKNKVLDKKEWKNFRTQVMSDSKLRKCGKKLPKYCDVNNDRSISMTEWLSCLNVHRPPLDDSEDKTSTNKPRKGPNPLEHILKDN